MSGPCRRGIGFLVLSSALLAVPTLSSRLAATQTTPAALSGYVIDGVTKQPLENATVTCVGNPQYIVTDAQGRFAWPALAPGTYSVVALKAGYAQSAYGQMYAGINGDIPQMTDVPATPRRLRTITLSAGEHHAPIRIALWPLGAAEGHVVDEVGQPVVGAQVQAWPRHFAAGRPTVETALNYTGYTDDRGHFRLSQMLPGEYVIVVPFFSMTMPTSPGPIAAQGNHGRFPLEMMAARLSTHASFEQLFGPGEGRKTLESAAISSSADQPSPQFDAVNGQHVGYATAFYGGTTVAAATPVTINPGADTTGLEIALSLQPVHSILGHLIGPPEAIGDAEVIAVRGDDPNATRAAIAVSDPNGAFTLTALRRGSYVIRAARVVHGDGEFFQPYYGSSTLMRYHASARQDPPTLWGEQSIAVNDADLTNVTLTLHPTATLSGRVVFEGAATPPAGMLNRVQFGIDRADGVLPTARAVTEIDVDPSTGDFKSVGVMPGRYVISAHGLPAGWFLQSVRVSNVDASLEPVRIETDDITGVVITLSTIATTLQGHVVNFERDGEDVTVGVFPAQLDRLTDYGERPRAIQLVTPDEHGAFLIRGLPSGEYCVVAIHGDLLARWNDATLFSALAGQAARVRLDAGDASAQVDAPISPLHIR